MTGIEVPEDVALAVLRAARTRKALEAAPELAFHLRWDALPVDGRTERGWLPEMRTPLLTAITDAADLLYVSLHLWTIEWAARLEVSPPTGWLWQRPIGGALLGFRAETTPGDAADLVRSATGWLDNYAADIAALDGDGNYQDGIAHLVWSLRAAGGLNKPQTAPALWEMATRECPNPDCGEHQVRAEYFGEPLAAAVARGERLKPMTLVDETEEEATNAFISAVAGVRVRCAACGWEPPLRPSKIARWLA